MTNEEIVAEIKAGNNDLYLELWKGIEPFVRTRAWMKAWSLERLDCFEDMLQESVVRLYDAVPWYDESFGKSFLSCFAVYYMPVAFNKVLYGGRSKERFLDPLNNYVDIDGTAYDTEGLTVGEMIEDAAAQMSIDAVTDRIYAEHLNRVLTEAINSTIREELTQEILLFHLNHVCTLEQGREMIAPELTYDQYYNQYNKGLLRLRRYCLSQKARSLIDLESFRSVNSSLPYRGSLSSYNSHMFTSTTERVALFEIDAMENVEAAKLVEAENELAKAENELLKVKKRLNMLQNRNKCLNSNI